MIGRTLAEIRASPRISRCSGFFVKTPVFPFVRFPGVDTLLGPEMKSTGEVMGGAETFGSAFAKAQMGAGQQPAAERHGVHQRQQPGQAGVVPIARELAALGFALVATRGTAAYLRAHGLDVDIIFKINEGRPHVGDELLNRRIALVINTPLGRESFFDDRTVRSVAMLQGVPAITTLTGAAAAVSAIQRAADRRAERASRCRNTTRRWRGIRIDDLKFEIDDPLMIGDCRLMIESDPGSDDRPSATHFILNINP